MCARIQADSLFEFIYITLSLPLPFFRPLLQLVTCVCFKLHSFSYFDSNPNVI